MVRKSQPGVSAGGPIQRDKTFFFFAFEQSWENAQEWSDFPRRYASAINSALARPAFAGAGLHIPLLGLFSSGENDTELSIKGTHLVNGNKTLTARYAFSRGKVRNDVQSGDNFTDQSARGSSMTGDHSLVAGLSPVISPTKINDVRVQWSQRPASRTMLVLSARDTEAFVQALLAPAPEVGPALRHAAKRYKKRLGL